MSQMPFHKYRPYETVSLADRTWPDVVLAQAPIWCSTDLRDGNQALVSPMDAGRKRKFFELLIGLGSSNGRTTPAGCGCTGTGMSSLASPSGEGGGQARAGGNRRRDGRCASR